MPPRGRRCTCTCANCQRENCGQCTNCRGKIQFGGDGHNHARCIQRKCLLKEINVKMKKNQQNLVVAEENEEEAESKTIPNHRMGGGDSSDGKGLLRKKRNRSAKSLSPSSKAEEAKAYLRKGKRAKHRNDEEPNKEGNETSVPRTSTTRRRRQTRKVKVPLIDPKVVVRSEEDEENRNLAGQEEEIPPSRANSRNEYSRTCSSASSTNGGIFMESVSSSRASTPVWNHHHHPPKTHHKHDNTTSIPLLSQYLKESSSNSSAVYRPAVEPGNSGRPESPLPTPYGMTIPEEPPRNVCCGCFGARDHKNHQDQSENDDDDDEEPVLLCEGINCHREYHLACCIPSLAAVPEDPWLCQDCNSEGSTQALRDYLDAADAAKANFVQENVEATMDYVQYLLRKDSKEANIPDLNRFPESELERGGMTHSLALCDPSKLARTRRGNEMREPLSACDCVGKPIRMYNPIANQYHTGRIVDVRAPCLGVSTDAEFLVRFTAGKDDRKVHYHHWIMLEEHCIAIGSALVWARLKGGTWTPSIVWLRTARELITVQQLLNESEGEIFYKDYQQHQPQQQQQQGVLILRDGSIPTKKKHKMYALVRSFGIPEKYDLLNVRDQCISLKGTTEHPQNVLVGGGKNPHVLLAYQLALMEEQEQDRVRTWQSMTPTYPMHPSVFSSRDWYTVPRLELRLPKHPPCEHDARLDSSSLGRSSSLLCPNVIRGLDRSHVVEELKRRGMIPTRTKDVAISLHCEVMPVNANTLFRRPAHRRPGKQKSLI